MPPAHCTLEIHAAGGWRRAGTVSHEFEIHGLQAHQGRFFRGMTEQQAIHDEIDAYRAGTTPAAAARFGLTTSDINSLEFDLRDYQLQLEHQRLWLLQDTSP